MINTGKLTFSKRKNLLNEDIGPDIQEENR